MTSVEIKGWNQYGNPKQETVCTSLVDCLNYGYWQKPRRGYGDDPNTWGERIINYAKTLDEIEMSDLVRATLGNLFIEIGHTTSEMFSMIEDIRPK